MKWKDLYAIADAHLYLETPKNTDTVTDSKTETREIIGALRSLNPMTENKYQERRKKFTNFVQAYKPKVFFQEGSSYNPLLKEVYDEDNIVLLDKDVEEYYAIQAVLVVELKKIMNIMEDYSTGRITKEDRRNAVLEILRKLDKPYLDLRTKREKKWVDKVIHQYKEPSAIKCGFFHVSSGLVNYLKLLRHFPRDIFRFLLLNEKPIFVKELKPAGIKVSIKEVFS